MSKLIEESNSTPVYGVLVGLFGFFVSDMDEFQMDDTSDLYKVSDAVMSRYGHRAFGFRRCFYLHGKQHFTDAGWVYLHGKIRTADEILNSDNPSERILRENVRINGIKSVIDTGGRTFPFDPEKDVIL